MPTTVSAGDYFFADLVALDVFDNVVSNASDELSIMILSGPSESTLLGSVLSNCTNGYARFNISVCKPGMYVFQVQAKAYDPIKTVDSPQINIEGCVFDDAMQCNAMNE